MTERTNHARPTLADINMNPRFSQHALFRMNVMAVTRAEVLDVIRQPEHVSRGVQHDDMKYRKNDLTISLSADLSTVITVLWRDRNVMDRSSDVELRTRHLARKG